MGVESSFQNFQNQWDLIKKYGQSIIWCNVGKGPFDLAREISKGESNIRYISSSEAQKLQLQEGLLREASISCIYIYHNQSNGRKLQLIEAMQVYHKTGEMFERGFEWATEKQFCPPDKNPEDTAIRALGEEIGLKIKIEDNRLRFRRQIIKEDSANTYPNLQSRMTATDFEITLTDKEYNNKITLPDGNEVFGFKEVQKDENNNIIKTTYFIWKEIN